MSKAPAQRMQRTGALLLASKRVDWDALKQADWIKKGEY
jgi:hypothetical protein